jgi:SAM-dependent methyltransferase
MSARTHLEELLPRYRVDLALVPERLAARFVALGPDEETEQFLHSAERRRAGPLSTRLHRWLGRFLSDFDVNGLLDLYPLHLLGTEQFRRLLGSEGARGSLLDVGAGSGDVTVALAPLFDHVTAFETSAAMRRRLGQRGLTASRHDLAAQPTTAGPFDLVACLNVLDRCAEPRRLLDHAVQALAPGGRVLIALALPYAPFYYHRGRTLDPEQPLGLTRSDWEGALVELVVGELEPRNLVPIAWTRAPYLSAGDTDRPLYVLDDAVLVLGRGDPL